MSLLSTLCSVECHAVLEITWKEVVVANLKFLPGFTWKEWKKSTKIISSKSRENGLYLIAILLYNCVGLIGRSG